MRMLPRLLIIPAEASSATCVRKNHGNCENVT